MVEDNPPDFDDFDNPALKVPLEEQLKAFLAHRDLQNAWIGTIEAAVYLRKSRRALKPGGLTSTLDIANVDVREPWRRKGIFTAFLDSAEKLNPYEAVFVENVVNPYLIAALIRRGYEGSEAYSVIAPSLYKFVGSRLIES